MDSVLPALKAKYGSWKWFDGFAPRNLEQTEQELKGTKKIPNAKQRGPFRRALELRSSVLRSAALLRDSFRFFRSSVSSMPSRCSPGSSDTHTRAGSRGSSVRIAVGPS